MSTVPRDTHPRSAPADRPRKQAALTAQRIVQDIESGGLGLGDHLPAEKEMLTNYNVGRGTLREALRVLELQGVLTIRPGPGGGPVVASPDSRHLASTLALLMQFAETPFRAVIEARLHIEPITAGLCADRASDEVLEDIRRSVETMGDNLGNQEIFLDENRSFHDLVAWGSGNSLYGYFINSLHWITDGTVLGVNYPEKFRRLVWQAHVDVCEAIESRSYDAASAAMTGHMDNTSKFFEQWHETLLAQPLKWELYGR